MEVMSPPQYTYIDTSAALETLAHRLESQPVIGVDLEADSLYHFKEKVCLIQIAAADESFVIDPLAIQDVSALAPIFARNDIQKVFHGADYDIRSLYRDYSIEVNNLFDTELASRFMGAAETGLEAVLLNRFQVQLDKKYQKKDWSQRPLPPKMVAYASQDVVFLPRLAGELQRELSREKRLSWVAEECELLSKVRPVSPNGQPLFLKFKGAGRLEPKSLALLENLLHFRNQVAEKKDRPVFKVIGNETLKAIAIGKPCTIGELEDLGAMSPSQLNMYGKAIVGLCREAMALPESKLPRYPRTKRPVGPTVGPMRLNSLKQWRDQKAEKLGLDPAIICSKALVYAIATEAPSDMESLKQIEGMKGWQVEAFGRDMLSVLNKMQARGRGKRGRTAKGRRR
jgi:ribonuclease D